MKKLMSLVALAVIGSVVAASAQEVLSANAVGYIKKTVQPSQLAPVVYPFDIIGSEGEGGILFTNMQVAADLPANSKVHFWNGETWDTYSKTAMGWGGQSRNKRVAYGEMFFIQPAANSQITEFTLAGEVPDAPKTVRKITANGSLDAVGVAYPTEQVFTNTTIAIKAPAQSRVHFWNGETWETFTKTAMGWGGQARNKKLEAGEGFFIELKGTSVDWEQDKPYSWP